MGSLHSHFWRALLTWRGPMLHALPAMQWQSSGLIVLGPVVCAGLMSIDPLAPCSPAVTFCRFTTWACRPVEVFEPDNLQMGMGLLTLMTCRLSFKGHVGHEEDLGQCRRTSLARARQLRADHLAPGAARGHSPGDTQCACLCDASKDC